MRVDGPVAGGVAQSVDRSGGAPVVGDTIQLGIAVDIPEPWGGALTRRRVEAGDPLVVPAHVTLLGPTEIPVAALPAVERHLAAVAVAHLPFTLHLRGTGTFRPVTQVVFVAVAAGISECELLAAAISAAPELHREARFPYHPHVTVAQDVAPEALDRAYEDLADFSAMFEVGSFTLFSHSGQARWQPRRDFLLGV
nr:2'-5' RNA ligase family protein [Micromonospora rubida]